METNYEKAKKLAIKAEVDYSETPSGYAVLESATMGILYALLSLIDERNILSDNKDEDA